MTAKFDVPYALGELRAFGLINGKVVAQTTVKTSGVPIRAHEEGQFDWLLHYAGEAHATGAVVELSNGPAKASLTMLYPVNPVIHEEIGLAADAPDEKIKYLKLSTPTKCNLRSCRLNMKNALIFGLVEDVG